MPQAKEPETNAIGKVNQREVVDEMKESYIDYAMSVIVARALPDVRDGLKPVHRRILYAMLEEGLRHTSKFRKSATVVGAVLGRYHPHGDTAVYDAMARLAQDFNIRYPLVQGQGNFGCFTKDTKIKLTDGRSLSFGALIEEQRDGRRHWTFAYNRHARAVEIAEVKRPRKTIEKAEILEVTLDNGAKITCTPGHRFLLRNGRYKEARHLQPSDSLMAGYFNLRQIRNQNRYAAILQPIAGRYVFVHRLADQYNGRMRTARTDIASFLLHHKDFNRLNNNPDNIQRVTFPEHREIHDRQAKLVWERYGDRFREKHRLNVAKALANPLVRRKISENSKRLWQEPAYRDNYPADHFSSMAKVLWKNPETAVLHREKIKKQWDVPLFRIRQSGAVRKSNLRRMASDPGMMARITGKAKTALARSWKNPQYKSEVIRSKILRYVHTLLQKYQKSEITEAMYNRERYNNCFPKFSNAVTYFTGLREIVERAEYYNHRIVSIRRLPNREDVYDITIDDLHNFLLDAGVFVHNSNDGDSPAAQRYTEARLSSVGEEMLRDIDKDTVRFVDNYDGTRKEPAVLPSPLPQLLLNGSLGIAVGMATNVPPHNLSELIDACVHLIDNPKAETSDLFQFVQGPDFPTGGIIYDQKEIITAYSQGKGSIVMRGKAEIVSKKDGSEQIIVSEIPYQVLKSTLVEEMAELVAEKKIEGIRDIKDLSDRAGMAIVIDVKKGFEPQRILNRLYKFTNLQKTFHLNLLALVDGIQPEILSLAQALRYFLAHRKEVVTRRTQFDLDKARERAHILEGLKIALDHIDAVIALIKKSKDREEAKVNLTAKFKLTERQAVAILEMRLQTLAGLERKKIEDELKAILALIKELEAILKSPAKLQGLVKKELLEMKEKFGDSRRTKVVKGKLGEMTEIDLVPLEDTMVTLTTGGYIKRINPATYKIQKRGGKGIVGMKTMQDDVVEHFIYASTHDNLLFFTDSGKVFQIQVYEIPEGTRVARGRGLVNFLEISSQEKALSLVPLAKSETGNGKFLVMVTKHGRIKKTSLEAFENVRRSGIIAITLEKGDLLKKVVKTSGGDEIILTTRQGMAIRFAEKDIRAMGRGAAGVKGIRLRKGDEVIGIDVIAAEEKGAEGKKPPRQLLVVMDNGYGKRTEISQYKRQGRGGSGIKTANITAKTGGIVFASVLVDSGKDEDLIVISQQGQVIRTAVGSVSLLGRATQGVRIMRLGPGDKIASGACVKE